LTVALENVFVLQRKYVKRGAKILEFLNEIEIKVEMKPKTTDHFIIIYKLCKDFPKFLYKKFSFYIKIINK
jgi:hypothetical protein